MSLTTTARIERAWPAVAQAFARRWVTATVAPWAGCALLVLPLVALLKMDSTVLTWLYFSGVAAHCLSLDVLPHRGWAAARLAARAQTALGTLTGDHWIVSSPAPTWTRRPALAYTAGLAFQLAAMALLLYVAFFVYPSYLMQLVLFNWWWWDRCREDWSKMALLERRIDADGASSFVLWGMVEGAARARPVSITRIDQQKGEIHLLMFDVPSTWSPVDGLDRFSASDVAVTPAPDKEPKESEVPS